MQFQIISDLHLEYFDDLPNINDLFIKSAPNIILGGDVCYFKHPNFEKFFNIISKMYNKIFFIPGNHDYYAHYEVPELSYEVIDFIMEKKLKKFKNVYFIQNNFVELDNVIIAGTTLWCRTNKTLLNHPKTKLINNEFYILFGQKFMPSLKKIAKINDIQYKWLSDFILQQRHNNKKLIIVTHYLPSKKCIHKKYEHDSFNDLYFTPCDHLFKYVNFWISGHTHNYCNFISDKCNIIVNPIGDPFETTTYNKKLVIDISKNQAHL